VTFIRRFGRFWYDFIVGDDWRLAVGVIVAIPLAAGAAHSAGIWWLLPLMITLLLSVSVGVATRRARRT
jgi:hypothetical protein